MPRTVDGQYLTKGAEFLKKAQNSWMKTEYEKARLNYKNAIDAYDEVHDNGGKIEALKKLAELELSLENYDEGEICYNLALDSIDDETSNQVPKVLCGLGQLYIEAGDFENANIKLKQAKEAYEEDGKLVGVGKVNDLLALMCMRSGEEDKALDFFMNAIEIYENSGNLIKEAKSRRALSRLYMLLKEDDKAHEELEHCVELFRENGDLLGEAGALTGIGILRRKINDYEKAQKALNKAVFLYQKANHPMGEGEAMLHLARVEAIDAKNGDLEKARKHYQRCIKLFKLTNANEFLRQAEEEYKQIW